MTYRRFPAKVLLFGEHLLLRGATALSVPLHQYGGHWAWTQAGKASPLQGRLRDLANNDLLNKIPGLSVSGFQTELERGIWFHSNIPSGYGLGSSGVLCAGIYDRYCHEKTDSPSEMKAIFAQMESFFHGRSSGIDPLTSYYSAPIVVRENTKVELPTCPDWSNDFSIFLLDSREPRQSGNIIAHFQEYTALPDVVQAVDRYLAEVHEPLLEQFLAGNFSTCWEKIGGVSAFQWRHQRFMIPESLHFRWKQGLDSGDFFFKICGAGGGGYSLVFAKKPEVAQFLQRLHRMTPLRYRK